MNKDLNYYLSLHYQKVITEDFDEGGYIVSFPDLPGCITIVDNLSDVEEMANEAKEIWIKAAIEDGYAISEPSQVS